MHDHHVLLGARYAGRVPMADRLRTLISLCREDPALAQAISTRARELLSRRPGGSTRPTSPPPRCPSSTTPTTNSPGPASSRPSPAPVAVTVTGTARGTSGWTAATAPYRLDCLTVQDPVAGWLLDELAVTAPPPALAAG